MTGPPIEIPEFPWMPWYVDDILALAAVLSTRQLGAIVRLRAFAWRQTPRCTLPDDDRRLRTIAGLDESAWLEDGPVLRERLTPMDGGRLLDEQLMDRFLEQVKVYRISQVRRKVGAEGGRKSAEARANQTQSKPPSKPASKGLTKIDALLEVPLGSSSSTELQSLKGTEANPQANGQAKPDDPTNLIRVRPRGTLDQVPWREAIDPARAARERGEREVGSTTHLPPAPSHDEPHASAPPPTLPASGDTAAGSGTE